MKFFLQNNFINVSWYDNSLEDDLCFYKNLLILY